MALNRTRKLSFCFIVGIFIKLSSNESAAATFVTVADASVNIDRIAYIQPSFCDDGGIDLLTLKELGIQQGNGGVTSASCSFVIVFAGGEYKVNVGKNGVSAQHKATDKMTIMVRFGPEQDIKTQVEAQKALKLLRDLLPR